jgi:RNA polymerase sigma-70 factor, ECF subfamily
MTTTTRERAYVELVEPHRSELRAHCRRILGSADDAEDAVQEAMVSAWRGLSGFEGRSGLRAWLYRIATDASLDAIERRSTPVDATELEGERGALDPRYERREEIEVAVVAALRVLPANQRAALVLRDAMGFSARDTADVLGTTVAAVNSALQRARAAIGDSRPDRAEAKTLRALRDERLRAIAERYVDAWERDDVDAVVSMLTEEASFRGA